MIVCSKPYVIHRRTLKVDHVEDYRMKKDEVNVAPVILFLHPVSARPVFE